MSNVCYDPTSGAPIPCGGFTVYNSYGTDPRYQRYFTLAWTCTLGLALLLTVPSILTSVRAGRLHRRSFSSLLGVSERTNSAAYQRVDDETLDHVSDDLPFRSRKLPRPILDLFSLVNSASRWSLPLPSAWSRWTSNRRFASFSFGKLLLTLLIPIFYLVTLLPESQLRENPNRFGFLALAGLPPLFLLSSKNGATSWLLGKSWTTVNFLHRWLGRAIVLLVLLHFYFWTVQYSPSHTVTEFLTGSKERRGIGALSFLLLIAFSSAGPLRRWSYPLFFALHYVGLIGFLTFVNLHTIYARTWATWSIAAIYSVDLLGRLASLRMKLVEVEALDEGMTRIGIPYSNDGWRGGQHLQLRLFFSAPGRSIWSCFRAFEQHPFSIANASASTSVIKSFDQGGIDLYARSRGKNSWTKDLYRAAQVAKAVADSSPRHKGKKFNVYAFIEGPYGGLDAYDAMKEETLLFIAGGSGMSFVLGALDEVVGRRVREGKGGKIEVNWVVHQAAHIKWFEAPLLALLDRASPSSNLSIHLQVHITSPSSTHLTPLLPTTYSRPSLRSLLNTSIDATLAPCGKCFPICRCGELRQDGVCANDEEECVGSLEVANARELIEEVGEEKRSCCSGGNKEKGEVDAISSIAKERTGCVGGCCSAGSGEGGRGCCSSLANGTTVQTRPVDGPVRVRTGGYKVIVCGPPSMITETRQAVALIPLAKQVRLGGVGLHVESYGV